MVRIFCDYWPLFIALDICAWIWSDGNITLYDFCTWTQRDVNRCNIRRRLLLNKLLTKTIEVGNTIHLIGYWIYYWASGLRDVVQKWIDRQAYENSKLLISNDIDSSKHFHVLIDRLLRCKYFFSSMKNVKILCSLKELLDGFSLSLCLTASVYLLLSVTLLLMFSEALHGSDH